MAGASRLELALNDAVQVTTTGGESVSGTVLALDEQTHTLVLRLAAGEGAWPGGWVCILGVRGCVGGWSVRYFLLVHLLVWESINRSINRSVDLLYASIPMQLWAAAAAGGVNRPAHASHIAPPISISTP
jgi:hypothetical protein